MFFFRNTVLSNPVRPKMSITLLFKDFRRDLTYRAAVLIVLQRNYTIAAAVSEVRRVVKHYDIKVLSGIKVTCLFPYNNY